MTDNNIQETPDTEIDQIFAELQENFETLQQLPISWRKGQLKTLITNLQDHEEELLQALQKDLGGDLTSVKLCQLGLILDDFHHIIDNLDSWTAPKKQENLLQNFPSDAYVKPQGKGVIIVLGCWNYPILTYLSMVATAIAAGNCVMMKPSEVSSNSAQLLHKIICQNGLDPRFYKSILGGPQTGQKLSSQKCDQIIFTGGTFVGSQIAKAAAANLVPCILELGGKCPMIIDKNCDVDFAAKRTANFKFINCGQTCIAPDYILIHKDIEKEFTRKLIGYLKTFFISKNQLGENGQKYTSDEMPLQKTPTNPVVISEDKQENVNVEMKFINNPKIDDFSKSPSWFRMIHSIHAERVWKLLEGQEDKIIYQGGKPDFHKRFVPPVVVRNPGLDTALMTQEIFGPILPIISYSDHSDVFKIVNDHSRKNPLSIYYFGDKSGKFCKELQQRTCSGNFVVNDLLVNYATFTLPFGGVGRSGYGKVHGYQGFCEVSNMRSYLVKSKKPMIDEADVYFNVNEDPRNRLWRMNKLTKYVGKSGCCAMLGLMWYQMTRACGCLGKRPQNKSEREYRAFLEDDE